MMDAIIEKDIRRLTTPRAAAIAGILFGLLFGASLVLLRSAIPAAVSADTSWVQTGAWKINLALGLMPFAGIAYLWFIGVVRDRLGEFEDKFFSTVFFGSSLLFLAMVFISMAVVDTSKGATIIVPVISNDRYVSVHLIDNDHYCPLVIYSSGTHELPRDTKYLGLGVRIQVFNPTDADEVALVNKLQDQFIIKANSADPLPEFKWDLQSLKELTVQYEKDSAQYSSWQEMMGPRGKVDEKARQELREYVTHA